MFQTTVKAFPRAAADSVRQLKMVFSYSEISIQGFQRVTADFHNLRKLPTQPPKLIPSTCSKHHETQLGA